MDAVAPASAAEAAELLASGRTVRPRGGGTKWAWGGLPDPEVVLSTERLDGIVEHNAGDLTAVLGAGVRLADAQRAFAGAGQMLALDPPGAGATVGGIVAAADSGPLRHRYGAPRDLLLGMTVALSDGTVARSGGRVIKNVAGYDLAKLFAGSLGRLGTIVEAVVRLHPIPAMTATAVGETDDPAALARAALALAAAPLELEALDVRWHDGRGMLLAQAGGAAASTRARRAAELTGLDAAVHEDDASLWAEQREAQRSNDAIVLRVAGLPSALETVVRVAGDTGASLVGRAGVGTFWLRLPDEAALAEADRDLPPFPRIVTDAPTPVRLERPRDDALARLEERVKARFDPAGALP
jgi:glycolate dehydrogenase FAD-binding subunit